MTVFLSAVLLIGVAQNELQPAAAHPRALYQRAAKLLEANPGQPAVRVLEMLVEQHAQTYYAELATFHLAECYVILGEPLRAIELLDKWRDRLRFPSKQTDAIAPKLYQRAQALHTLAARAAASEYEYQQDYASAVKTIQKALLSAEDAERRLIEQEIMRTAVAGCKREMEFKHSAKVEDILASLNDRWQIPVRFALAESLIADGLMKAAEGQLTWLSAKAKEKSEQNNLRNFPADFSQDADASPLEKLSRSSLDGGHQGTEFPDWAFTVALRRCEIAVRQKQIAKAEKLIGACKDTYSDSEQSWEFDFLLARCAMARVEFSTALQLLREIGARESVPAPMHAKALWMSGEIHFLQRDFDAAIKHYRKTLATDAPAWQSRALLQMAKCQELSGQASAALQSYKRLQTQYGRTPDALHASARIAQLLKVLDDSGNLHEPEEQ